MVKYDWSFKEIIFEIRIFMPTLNFNKIFMTLEDITLYYYVMVHFKKFSQICYGNKLEGLQGVH